MCIKLFACEMIFTMFESDMFVTPKLHIVRNLYAHSVAEDVGPSLAIIELSCGSREHILSIIEKGFF
jgi:hypothetical protein